MGCEWQECVLAQTESEGLHTKHLDQGGHREQAVSHLIWICSSKVLFVFDILLTERGEYVDECSAAPELKRGNVGKMILS